MSVLSQDGGCGHVTQKLRNENDATMIIFFYSRKNSTVIVLKLRCPYNVNQG